ncbi:hypothetical protein L3X38_024987 [Prunus dulcis]|uniref:Uncharacterized protein n=1 Tax=Prunus dulcis TaxID=3755 RepID=A0AAD4Z708_PRUDU|nr:hypothetical protein L3X38_024987 [Prunus dulcis]
MCHKEKGEGPKENVREKVASIPLNIQSHSTNEEPRKRKKEARRVKNLNANILQEFVPSFSSLNRSKQPWLEAKRKRSKAAVKTQFETGPSYPSYDLIDKAAAPPPDTIPESTAPIAPLPGLMATNTLIASPAVPPQATATIGLAPPQRTVAKTAAQAHGLVAAAQ